MSLRSAARRRFTRVFVVSALAASQALTGCASQSTEPDAHSNRAPTSLLDEAARAGAECGQDVVTLLEGQNRDREWSESDRTNLERVFSLCLGAAIRLKTVNPPGDEDLAVSFYEAVFAEIGIKSRRVSLRGRPGLIATLPSTSPETTRESVLLYHHTDVVPVFPDQWARPDLAFSGSIQPAEGETNGKLYVWGRGALDMKSLGLMQMFAMAKASRTSGPRARTLVFIASPDEEVDAKGAKGILDEMRSDGALSDIGTPVVLLNEGGYAVTRNGREVHLIGAEEKGGAWLKLKHQDPLELLRFLHYKLDLWGHGRHVSRIATGCKLLDFETPGAQVNVSPSQARLRIECLPGSVDSRRIEKAFRSPFTSTKSHAERVTVAAQEETPGRFAITIRLSTAGHGSLGGLSSLQVAAHGLKSLSMLPPGKPTKPSFHRYQRTPAVVDFIRGLTEVFPASSRTGFLLRAANKLAFIDELDQAFLGITGEQAFSERLFRTSCSWTAFHVTPQTGAEALLDCRLVHTAQFGPDADHGARFMEELRALAQDTHVSIEALSRWNFTASPTQGRIVDVLKRSVLSRKPNAVVATWLAPTSSDSAFFRAPRSIGSNHAPIASYGFYPVDATGLTGTIHGSDERFPVDQAFDANLIYTRAVLGLLGTGSP